jgi:hypothetical protein
MRVVKAVYGSSKGERDVTAEAARLVGSARTALFYVSNGPFGDPCPYAEKVLTFTYEHEGIEHTIVVPENTLLIAPPSTNASLGIWYSNNDVEPWVLGNSIGQLGLAQGVDILTCPWHPIVGNPFPERLFPYRIGSHLSICLQILTMLSLGRAIKRYDRVFFLEHDVLYPEDYFDMPEVPAPLMVNDQYIGMHALGFQTDKDDHEPLHQMVMDHDFALAHFHALLDQYLRGDGMNLEPNDKRVRRHSKTPAIHMNHGRHLTSHCDTYRPAIFTDVPYWGSYSLWWKRDAFANSPLPAP